MRLALFACLALLAPPGLLAQAGGDLQARIVYAFETEDVHALEDVALGLTARVADDGRDFALRYHLAHADFRLASLIGAARPQDAATRLGDCVEQLKQVPGDDPLAVEALALEGACESELAGFRRLQAVLLRARAAERLRRALAMAPHNPRVLYLSAVEELARARPGTAARRLAFARLEGAAAAFEATSATSPDVPGWGHAEAYLALGQELAARGDRLGARNWVEKALIVAPDYRAAQRARAALSGG